MTRLLLEHSPALLHVASIAFVGCMFIQYPSMWLLLATLAYGAMRAGGLGEQLGQREMRRVDTAVMGGILLMVGFYALACRAVAQSGLVTASALTGIYVGLAHKLTPQPTWLMRFTIGLAWALIVYRWFHPTTGCSLFPCCTNVG
jgi:hypothetical protein